MTQKWGTSHRRTGLEQTQVSSKTKCAKQPIHVFTLRLKSSSIPGFKRIAGCSSPAPLPADVTPSKASSTAERASFCMFLNAALFLSVWQFFHLRAFILQPTHTPAAATHTALLFGNKHLLASFHHSLSQFDTLPTTCLRISFWVFFCFLPCVANCLPHPTWFQPLVIKYIFHQWSTASTVPST